MTSRRHRLAFAAVLSGSALFIAAPAARAQETVELELALAVDVSSSVTMREFGLQMAGIAFAFRHPDVVAAVESLGPRGMAVCLIHWSGTIRQEVAVEWTRVSDEASLAAFAARIAHAERNLIGETSVGPALAFAAREIEQNAYAGRRQTIDLSGDGDASYGDYAKKYRDAIVGGGMTINGLALLTDDPNLAEYYRDNVIGGPNAFVMAVADYDDFAEAMVRKLVREILPALTLRIDTR